jgi:hypothetical protein
METISSSKPSFPKQDSSPIKTSGTLIKLFRQQVENNFSYKDLLSVARCYWPEIAGHDFISREIKSRFCSIEFTEPIEEMILILTMVANGHDNPDHVTSAQIKKVLNDLTKEDGRGSDLKNDFNDIYQPKITALLENNDFSDYLGLVRNGIDRLRSEPLLYGSFIAGNALVGGFFDVTPTINDNLEKKDALSFSSTCKTLYLKFNLTLNIHTWKIDDMEKFKIADELTNRTNKKLPDLKCPLESFKDPVTGDDEAKKKIFHHLANDCVDLYLHLRKNPKSVNDQDANGMTLLHYAASSMGYVNALLIQQLLFNVPDINLHVRDCMGNTPFHLALQSNKGSKNNKVQFQHFAKHAIDGNFDCGIRGERGMTILHMAAVCTYIGYYRDGGNTNLVFILDTLTKKNIPNLRFICDSLSDSGSTAFYYCLTHRAFDAALALAAAGADPKLFGYFNRNDLRDPMRAISDIDRSHLDRTDNLKLNKLYDVLLQKGKSDNCIIS